MGKTYQWTESEISFLKKWYPHFGSGYIINELKLTQFLVNRKADSLKVRMLPKAKRLYMKCKIGHQEEIKNNVHRLGFYCRSCFNEKRRERRGRYRRQPKVPSVRLNELLRSARRRSSVPCDLTIEFLLELLDKQEGKCYYSGIQMEFVQWGNGRNNYSVSIDQVEPSKGYTKDNIVLCCWGVNQGKGNMSAGEYIRLCKCVAGINGGI